VLPVAVVNTMRPSGSQLGSATFAGLGDNRWIALVATVYANNATSPSRVDTKTIVFPSVLHAGSTSVVVPSVSDDSAPRRPPDA
jgi:hypothetical protein